MAPWQQTLAAGSVTDRASPDPVAPEPERVRNMCRKARSGQHSMARARNAGRVEGSWKVVCVRHRAEADRKVGGGLSRLLAVRRTASKYPSTSFELSVS